MAAAERSRSDSIWTRNLLALWFSQGATLVGFSFAIPFLPIFLHQELHVRDPHQLALWAGLSASANGIAMAIVSPFWGALADRRGRKRMLVRAMIGGALILALTSLVQTPPQLVGARFLMGAMAGTTAAATALVAAETPRVRVAWALGVLNSAVAIGRAIGPLIGSLLTIVLGLRSMFLAGAILILIPVVPIALAIRETPLSSMRSERGGLGVLVRTPERAHRAAIAGLVVAQGLVQFSYVGAQQMAVLRILQLEPARATIWTGAAFTVLGICTGAAALTYSSLARRSGLHQLTLLAGILMGAAVAVIGLAPGPIPAILAIGVVGACFGALVPALASMLGLEAPAHLRATMIGIGASATAVGAAVGPLAAGSVAAVADIPAGLYVAAAACLLMSMVVVIWGREPPLATASQPP